MDPLLRGLCEEHIDEKILESDFNEINKIVEILDLQITSKEDVSIGLFLGIIYDVLNNQCMKVYKRPPNIDEINDFLHILERRTVEFRVLLNKPQEKENNFEASIKIDFEDNNVDHESQMDDIEIDWNASSKRRKRRTIMGIPIPLVR
jgi:hypothetical protein